MASLLSHKTPFIALRLVLTSALLGLVGFLFIQFVRKDTPSVSAPNPSQKINLALRRTAHHLLRAAGDSTSRIPPVYQSDAQTYSIQFNRAFNYDSLPRLLDDALQAHQIKTPYDVAVLDCAKRELQLGYNVVDLHGEEPVPCGGRSLTEGCYILQVTFTQPFTPTPAQRPAWPLFALGSVLTVLLIVLWQKTKRVALASSPTQEAGTTPLPHPDPTQPAPDHRLYFGTSWFDPTNQQLQTGTQLHNLTYREAKLLRVLIEHANQVLDRDRILQLVWADEGVTVGRSVDVFVSRLRKLLAEDEQVRIVAVHGVGYRFEVRDMF
jgi:hypothetical protein